jgi:tRNA nucleotidyltransferase/poly(A) polymerase
MQDLSAHLAHVARDIATTLGWRRHRAWIVGGAPRDLALGLSPDEIDMASAARPEEVESSFEHTIPVGRAFGTLVIHREGIDVQHTTFRSEEGYSDGRRPDSVAFGKTIEEDSARRDFTCNALYLDPLTDELRDPQRGLEDLAARRLACVGDPLLRFEEDGLRLLRMARFAAALDLEPTAAVLAAARAARETLRGVSPERVLAELVAIFEKPRAVRALELLHACGLLDRAIPGLWGHGLEAEEAAWPMIRRAFEALPAPCGASLGLATLLAPAAHATSASRAAADEPTTGADRGWLERLEIARALRASRATQNRVREIWEIARAIEQSAERSAPPKRSERLRWMQRAAFDEAIAFARARAGADSPSAALIGNLLEERERSSESEIRPAALITPEDLAAAGIPRGPRWGELLREAETRQLDRELCSRDEALAWISACAARDQEGGKTPRRK